MDFLNGTGVALVTPFDANEEVDYDALAKVIEHVIAGGVQYIVAMGTTAETATLFEDEIQPMMEFIKKTVNGRVPIVLGMGGNDTWDLKEVIKRTDFEGISALLSVSPYYNRPQQEGIYQHYKQIAEASPVPIILYNVPSRTGGNISADTTLRLANDCPNIIATKEASGNLIQCMEIIQHKPQGFKLISGDDALALPLIACGASGAISVVANVAPVQFSALINSALSHDFTKAQSLQYQLLPLIQALFDEASPSGIKAALHQKNICDNRLRLPLVPVSDTLYNHINQCLQSIALA
jgi:4-hydroxy-tetrahydrodipicolinate synthase